MHPNDLATCRLAVYGTLCPGQPNHHLLSGLEGRWIRGRVRGRLLEAGWGAAVGYPGLILDEPGEIIDVWVLESADLPSHWTRLDEFEGPGYRRTEVVVTTAHGELTAAIYALAVG